MKNLWQRLRCWVKHDFKLIPVDFEKYPEAEGYYTREVIPGCFVYDRACSRCGVQQHISTHHGIHFLERQWKP